MLAETYKQLSFKKLFRPKEAVRGLPRAQVNTIDSIDHEIRELILQRDYPCIGALQAIKKNEYRIGIFKDFGTGESAPQLHTELLKFLAEQKQTQSPYLTYWATFIGDADLGEEEFEKRLWIELSHVSGLDTSPWDPAFSSNPADEKFCFSLGGSAFFVVGLHKNSSRRARRFKYCSIVFNLYEQFEIITRMGQYESMVAINRKKDIHFQGDVNPMVEKYGDKWEAIQFSGRQNDPKWKCPFHRFMKKWSH